MTPAAIEAAARALHRFNAPRVANDVEPWESVPPNTQARWKKQAELALLAVSYDVMCADLSALRLRLVEAEEAASVDPFARLSRPNIDAAVAAMKERPFP